MRPVSGAGAMRQSIDAWLGPRRFTLGLFGAFALTAVFLAIVGLYGLVSYAVSQRASEFGLRMAIGATPGDVQRMIFRQAALLGLAGSAVGAGLAAAAWPLIAGVVHDAAIIRCSPQRRAQGSSASCCWRPGCLHAAPHVSNRRSR